MTITFAALLMMNAASSAEPHSADTGPRRRPRLISGV
jgi:hypothetical protein